MLKKILIPILSLLFCLVVIGKWTKGFTAFTIFSYTLKEAGDIGRQLPDLHVINQNGESFNLKEKQKYVLLNFVYLNCPLACHKVNNQIENIYHLFDNSIVPNKLEFLTISFDPENDGIQRIKNYRKNFGDSISGWNFAIPYKTDSASFKKSLKEIGIWAYSVPNTNLINHSLYLFLISPNNTIIKVFDPGRDETYSIKEQILKCIEEGIK